MFSKIAVALAYSPRMEALICETKRVADLYQATVLFIHIGPPNQELEKDLRSKLQHKGFSEGNCQIIWEDGEPTKKLIEICRREEVDLLVTGAIKKETFLRTHFNSVARKIIRKGETSLLILLEPGVEPKSFKEIVINGTDHPRTPEIIAQGIEVAKKEGARHVHIVNEVQLMGLRMSMAGEDSVKEVEETRRGMVKEEIAKIEEILSRLDKADLKINIKIVTGKPGHEIAMFTEKAKADLLILRAPDHKLNFLDRFFPHDLEYILSDLPSNLLILHPKSNERLWRR
jgi:nucleotide-binding universal stress UspA family protein